MDGPERIPKFVCEKGMKRMTNVYKNDAKMEAEVMDLAYVSVEA